MLADITFGNADESVSEHLKCWIMQHDDNGLPIRCVKGVMGPGTTRTLQANWNSPFEQSNLGNIGRISQLAGIAQAASGLTSITTFSSTQVWEGSRPLSFSLVLQFYALRDAEKEVANALRALEVMASPRTKQGVEPGQIKDIGWKAALEVGKKVISDFLDTVIPDGRIPSPVMINIGPRMTIPNCVIENITTDLSKERTRDGYPIRAEVQLQISTKTMLNRDAIGETWF